MTRAEKDTAALLRGASLLRRDAAGYLSRGRCRYADSLAAAIKIGEAAGRAWSLPGNHSLTRAIEQEKRRIRSLQYAYERRCVGASKMA